jgi:hypothetical protein
VAGSLVVSWVGVVRDIGVLAFEFGWETVLLEREDLSILVTMGYFDCDIVSGL